MRLPDGVDTAGAAVLAEANAHAQLLADRAWVLVAACLVFFMQIGFLALEVGFVRLHLLQVGTTKNGKGFVLTCGDFANRFADAQTECRAIFASFRVL